MHLNVPHPRFLAFLALLAAGVGLLLMLGLDLTPGFIIAFDVSALAFMAALLPLWRSGPDPAAMRARAIRDDGGRVLLLVVMGAIAAAVLACVVDLLGPGHRDLPAAAPLAIATEIVAWGFANLVFALHYARLYYDSGDGGGDHGGIELPDGGKPEFADFASFALVIGMTCQTADITITGRRTRTASTLHGLLAFFFNLGVLAITVNIVASAI